MTRIEKSQNLGRLIRQDELSQLGVSTWTKIKEAIKAGKTQEALDLVDYLKIEGRRIHEVQCDNIWALETAIVTDPSLLPPELKEKYKLLIGKYLDRKHD